MSAGTFITVRHPYCEVACLAKLLAADAPCAELVHDPQQLDSVSQDTAKLLAMTSRSDAMFDGLLTSTIRYLLLAQVCMTCRISNIDWAARYPHRREMRRGGDKER